MAMSREQAWDLLRKYNKEEFHLRHAITVEHVMGWFARELGCGEEEAAFWSLAGLLHDLDFEMWPEEHCVKAQQLLRRPGRRRLSSTRSPATGGGSAAMWSPSTRWRRFCLPATSSPASSGRRR